MISKIIVFVCVQVAVFNAASSQCVNRIPGAFPVAETVIPNQMIYNPLPNQYLINPNQVFVNPPNQVLFNPPNQVFVNPPAVETVLPAPVPTILPAPVPTILPNPVSTTTIIQDSTVANNLANALQLLVVSNLLSNTLPNCAAPAEVIPVATYPAPIEVLPSYPGAIEVFPSFPGAVEVFSKVPVAPACGCGIGNYNFVY